MKLTQEILNLCIRAVIMVICCRCTLESLPHISLWYSSIGGWCVWRKGVALQSQDSNLKSLTGYLQVLFVFADNLLDGFDIQSAVLTKSKFLPRTFSDQSLPIGFFKTPIGIDWSKKVLDFYHFGKILDLFRGGNLFFVSTVVWVNQVHSLATLMTIKM